MGAAFLHELVQCLWCVYIYYMIHYTVMCRVIHLHSRIHLVHYTGPCLLCSQFTSQVFYLCSHG